mgnify:CR=1 FL=1
MAKQALAVMIPVLSIFFVGLIVFANTAIGKALARRIGGEAHPQLEQDVHQHLLDVQSDMAAMRQELLETQERLDFAERLIARQSEAKVLGAPGER